MFHVSPMRHHTFIAQLLQIYKAVQKFAQTLPQI